MPQQLAAYALIYLVYLAGKLAFGRFYGIHTNHLFLGFGSRPLFSFTMFGIRFCVGLFIPLPYLARFYTYESGVKDRIRQEWEYADHPIYRRLITIFGGAFTMLATSMILFSIAAYHQLETYIGKDQVDKYGIYPIDGGPTIGFEKGDRIIAVNEKPFERLDHLNSIDLNNENTFTVLRGADTLNLKYIPENFDDSDYDESVFYNDVAAINAPFEVDQVSQDSHAERIGLKPGDVFIRINETPVTSIDEFGDILSQFANDSVVIYLARDGKEILIETVVPEDRRLGFIAKPFMDYTTKRKTLSESAMYGIRQPFRIFSINLKAFSAFFGEAEVKSSRLSGPVSIDQLHGEGSWLSFLRLTALLLAVFVGLEFFPLPKTALTRCIPLISEGLIRRRLPFEYYAQIEKVLWILIFCWFIWSIIQDILKIF